MADLPSPDQVGTAAVWFTDKAGIAATILAVVSIALAVAYVWERIACRKALEATNKVWIQAFQENSETWGKRMDQFRADIKEAFGQNDTIADKVVEAMTSLRLEIARLSGRRDRD